MSSLHSSESELDLAVHKLLSLVLRNGMKEEDKYKKVNLNGGAGSKLKSSPVAMKALEEAGWKVSGTDLILPALTPNLAVVSARVSASYGARTPPSAFTAPQAKLSLKQQARLAEEERERAARLAMSRKKSRSGPSLKQQARALAEEEEKKSSEDARQVKEELRARLEADKNVRKNDPNWRPSAAGDKSQGKNQTTFRDKFGEGDGCSGGA